MAMDLRGGQSFFRSNPDTETVSHEGYRRTLEGMAALEGIDPVAFKKAVFDQNAVWGERIHHREAPETLADGSADAAIVYYHLALRYTRIFPEDFDFLPLGGTKERPQPHAENRVGKTHIGIVGDGGPWGRRFLDFMLSDMVGEIYAAHGLCHITGEAGGGET